MKATLLRSRVWAVCAAFVFAAAVSLGAQEQSKDKPKEQPVKLSDGERKALKKVTEAKDAAAKLAAAGDFVQKFPQSPARAQLADEISRAVREAPEAQRVSLAESFMNTFANAEETYYMYPVLIDGYINAGRTEDAFNAASTWLETNPNEAYILYRLALVGTNEMQRGNNKYAQQSAQYGLKAVELIEANQRPKSLLEEDWNKNKATWLPQLYQSLAIQSLVNNKPDDAATRLQKAIALSPNDPMSYFLLAGVKNEEYQRLVNQYKGTPIGPAQDAARQKAEAKLDEVIDLYARTAALSEGKPQFQAMREQTMKDLTTYYTFRHKNSTAGMQELINKYKTPATP